MCGTALYPEPLFSAISDSCNRQEFRDPLPPLPAFRPTFRSGPKTGVADLHPRPFQQPRSRRVFDDHSTVLVRVAQRRFQVNEGIGIRHCLPGQTYPRGGSVPAGGLSVEGASGGSSTYGNRWPTWRRRLSPECRAPPAGRLALTHHDRSPTRYRVA